MTTNPETTHFELNIDLDDVTTKIRVEYPKGRGLTALQALNMAGADGYGASLMSSLARNGDESILAAMRGAGVGLAGDDDLDD